MEVEPGFVLDGDIDGDVEKDGTEGGGLVPVVGSGSEGRAEGDDAADALAWLSLEVQKAQRQIVRGASEMAEGIVGPSVALLEIRQRRLYRLDPEPECAQSFAVFVQRRFQISERLARKYTDALASLGETRYQALLRDVGVQRTFALALLHQADAGLFEAFSDLAAHERAAVSTTQITAVAKQVVAEQGGGAEQIARLVQELGRQQGLLQQSRQRLHDVESVHQQTVQALIEERDTVRRSSEQQEQEIRQLRERLRTRPVAVGGSVGGSVSPPGRTRVDAAAVERPAVLVVNAFDVGTLVVEVRALQGKLEEFSRAEVGEIPVGQRRDLVQSLHALGQLMGYSRDTCKNGK